MVAGAARSPAVAMCMSDLLGFSAGDGGGTCTRRCPPEGEGFSSSPASPQWFLPAGCRRNPTARSAATRCDPLGNAGALGRGRAFGAILAVEVRHRLLHRMRCIIFCFSRSSSFLKRAVWQAASRGSRCRMSCRRSPFPAAPFLDPMRFVCVPRGPRRSPAARRQGRPLHPGGFRAGSLVFYLHDW